MKITVDREVMEQVLNSLERYQVKRQDFERFADEITALQEALAQPQQEPVALMWLVEMIMSDCGCSSNNQRLFERLIDRISQYERANTSPPAQQEPVAEVQVKMTGGNAGIATIIREIYDPLREPLQPGAKLYTSPPARKPLPDAVLVPLDILEAAESSLGSFCCDHGWSADDMQAMDNLSAYIAKHKAAHGIKE